MKRNWTVGVLLFAALLLSCERGKEDAVVALREEGTTAKVYGADIPEQYRDARKLNILFSDDICGRLESATSESGDVRLSSLPEFSRQGIVRMRRLFPDAGKFEARTRAAGLHRWYELYCESATKAAGGLTELPGVDLVEFNPTIEITGHPEVVEVCEDDGAVHQAAASSSTLPFDDPRLSSQWHYYNNGTASSAVSGCDINVFPAWRTGVVGSAKVIVAVVDGGIDFKHEDLAANMWHNPEKSGDMRYGYNFVNNSYQVTAEDHGTHVAGTIAAVNNNGKGVCGIAGGDAAAGESGVQLMSCQIFSGDDSGSGPAAIKWAADHGAVIAQNSWGYTTATTTPASLKAAVDYFIENAGIDENGNQTGPMKGGIVIFAAGNENTDVSGNDYNAIFNVASVGADYRRAYYSNYGGWVDIAAPGGDVRKGNQILSTLPGNKYGLMQGTSMACPHVSGVAALVVSKNGGKNYTPEQLIKKLTSSVTSISSYNPNYKLGAGLVNAYKAVASGSGVAPSTPQNLSLTVQSNNIHFTVNVPSDQDDGVPNTINLYYNKADFSRISDNLQFASFYVENRNVGDSMEGTITGLDFETDYYIAAAAEDLIGNKSGLSGRIMVKTGKNNPPVIHDLKDNTISIKPHESASADFEIEEPDGHFYTLELSPGCETGVVLDTTVRNRPKIQVSGPDIPSGSYTARLTVTDTYGLSAEKDIPYTVLANHAPAVQQKFEDVIFSSRSATTVEIHCDDYFLDPDGEQLTYTFSIDNETVVNMTAQDGKFFLTPMNYGYANIRVAGSDIRGETVEQTFRVLVRDGHSEVDVYPNPVRSNLYVRMGMETDAKVRIVSASGANYFTLEGHISPFEPIVVDMTKAPSGVYTVVVSVGASEYKSNVVKL